MARAKRIEAFLGTEVQRECQSLRKAMAIEEMAESMELASDSEEQAIQKGHP